MDKNNRNTQAYGLSSILSCTHTSRLPCIPIYPTGGLCSWKMPSLWELQHFQKSIKLRALLFNFLQSPYNSRTLEWPPKALNLTTVRLIWHLAFVTTEIGEWLSLASLLASDKKQQKRKKKESQWDLNQISINYASSGLHKTFYEAGRERLYRDQHWLK